MKTKCNPKAKAYSMLGKPGRYFILRQWTCGGPLMRDDNNGLGFSPEEVSALVKHFEQTGK